MAKARLDKQNLAHRQTNQLRFMINSIANKSGGKMMLGEIKDIEAIIRTYPPTVIAKFDAILESELMGDKAKAQSLKHHLTTQERNAYVLYLANSDKVIPTQTSVHDQRAIPILYAKEAQDSDPHLKFGVGEASINNLNYESRTDENLDAKHPKKDCCLM